MPFELGGRADKQGNRYEHNCAIYEMLKIIDEVNYSVVIEALGDDEKGTDILVTTMQNEKEHQQCKARNASKEYWDITDLKSKRIFKVWDFQLNRDNNRKVALVSPLVCHFLVDLHNRALNTSGKVDDFYNIQIMGSSKEFQRFYQDFCSEMGLNVSEESDYGRIERQKSIDYLKRIFYKQNSEAGIQENIDQSIRFLFRNDRDFVYNAMVSLVCMKDILGVEITQSYLLNYFKEQRIEMRLRDGDDRILPRFIQINQEYRDAFKPLKDGLVHRKEFDDCINAIKSEKSFIISGGAGYGKSGCTEAIIDYCEEENIPHIAIKLDHRIPRGNCDKWGRELGLSGSIVYAIHCISRSKKAVIVLDQLDALRWTQSNSTEALSVCTELIEQVRHFNQDREHKILVVFVCRAYDLENDNNIKLLFEKKSNKKENDWINIHIKDFDEDVVRKIIGEGYDRLSSKLKEILQIPSNLYIWQHLDKDDSYSECVTTSHLIEKWYQQICRKSITVGIQEKTVMDAQNSIVDMLDKMGRLYAPRQRLSVENAGLDYLISCEMILVQKEKVGFVHQSILDYFMSKRMTEKYYDGQSIEEVIGEKDKQTPSKRYQVQMFLQNILDYDTAEFIEAGEQLLVSENVRYYMKFIFYELLGQKSEPDDNILQFITNECENKFYGEYILNNVIFGRKQYVSALIRQGILEKWFRNPSRKEIVFRILQSISPNLDTEEITFIREHAFKSKEDDREFVRCIGNNLVKEQNEVFELWMAFYTHYPDFSENLYINLKSMLSQQEIRTIRLIAFWLSNRIESKEHQIFREQTDILISDNSLQISNGETVTDLLLPYIPDSNSLEVKYSKWSGMYRHMRGIERCCVELVKKANLTIIAKTPEAFWKRYEPYMGKGYYVFNEIILSGMAYLPENFSNRVISYLCSDLDKNIFDDTSGAEDKLELAKKVIKAHSNSCDYEAFCSLEQNICKYISSNAADWYRRRIEQNKNKEYESVYWSFWGDLQWELLSCLPKERIGKETEELLQVLNRRFEKIESCYYRESSQMGSVESPISGKNVGKKQWLRIITNEKLPMKRHSEWVEGKGCFVESSYSMYASDFRNAVSRDTEEMIQLVIEHKDSVLPAFISSLFSGVAFSENISKVPIEIIERMFREFPCDMETDRDCYFSIIVEKLGNAGWSFEVLNQLKEIALNHKESEPDKIKNTKKAEQLSSRTLHEHALNCIRGHAISAIGTLLWEDKKLLEYFKETIEKLIRDENPIIRFASLYVLWPSYNIDRPWAEERILSLYESDIRMVNFPDSKVMLIRLYSKYGKRILKVVKQCMKSADKELMELGGHAVCDFYIRYHEFEDIISDVRMKSKEQLRAILYRAVMYLKIDKYRELAKEIILEYRKFDIDEGCPLSLIFKSENIDAERDKKFLQELMKSNAGRRTTYAFTHFLEESAVSVVDYADIIIALCENVLQMEKDKLRDQWGIENEISKLIMALYDETANSEGRIHKQIAAKCLDLWDIMFEKQLGAVREISYKLMDR